MPNEWLELLRIQSEVGQLEITLSVVYAHSLTADEKAMVSKLLINEPTCTARRLCRAIAMLIPGEASSEEISNAIGKVTRILDPAMFRDSRWWEIVCAFKQFDELTSSDTIH